MLTAVQFLEKIFLKCNKIGNMQTCMYMQYIAVIGTHLRISLKLLINLSVFMYMYLVNIMFFNIILQYNIVIIIILNYNNIYTIIIM